MAACMCAFQEGGWCSREDAELYIVSTVDTFLLTFASCAVIPAGTPGNYSSDKFPRFKAAEFINYITQSANL